MVFASLEMCIKLVAHILKNIEFSLALLHYNSSNMLVAASYFPHSSFTCLLNIHKRMISPHNSNALAIGPLSKVMNSEFRMSGFGMNVILLNFCICMHSSR